MNNFKKIILKIACFVFAISSIALVSTISNNYSQATETETFVVNQETSVRKSTDGYYGLRFTATLNNAWFTKHVAKGQYATLGLLVYPKTSVDVTGKTVEAVKDEVKAVQFEYSRNSVQSSYTFSGAIVYNSDTIANSLVEGISLQDALNYYYAQEIEARAYVKVGGDIYWAENTYSTSMRKTAALSVIADPTNQAVYETYYNVVGEVTPLIAKGDATGTFYDLEVEDGAYELYTVDKKSIPVEVVDGALTVTDMSILNGLETGEYEAFLFADGNNGLFKDNKFYKVKFVLADVIISTPEELDAAFSTEENYTKYYALANDIDLADYTYSSSSKTLSGTFNGRGYAIKNFLWQRASGNIPASNSLLGGYLTGGTIKNVAFLDFWDYDWWTPSYVVARVETGTVENVYCRIDPHAGFASVFGYSNDRTSLKNVVVEFNPANQEYSNSSRALRTPKNLISVAGSHGVFGGDAKLAQNVFFISPAAANVYSFGNYNDTSKAFAWNVSFAENDEEMLYYNTDLVNGEYVHNRVDYPSDMVTVLNNYNDGLAEGVAKYDFDPNNLTVDDFIKYSEVDGNNSTVAKRITGFKRYNNYQEMAKANESLNGFVETGLWSVVNGIPYWHSEVVNATIVNVDGTDIVGDALGMVGRGQSAKVAITVNGNPVSVNYVTTADSLTATASGDVIYGINNGTTSIIVNYTYGGNVYNKTVPVEVTNPVSTISDLVLYNADTKQLLFDIGDEEIYSATYITDKGQFDADVTDGLITITDVPVTGSNKLTVALYTSENVYKFANVEYWDYIIDNALQFADVMSFTTVDPLFTKWVTLANDINMRYQDGFANLAEVLATNSNLIPLDFDSFNEDGVYVSVRQDSNGDNPNCSIGWTNNEKHGFAGIFDGKGYSVNNLTNYKTNLKNSHTSGNPKITSNMAFLPTIYSDAEYHPQFKNVAFNKFVGYTSNFLGYYRTKTGTFTVENLYFNGSQSYSNPNTDRNANGAYAVSNTNAYGTGGLFRDMNGVKMTNVVVEENHTSVVSNNNASNENGILFGAGGRISDWDTTGPLTLKDVDNNFSNVIYMTTWILHSGWRGTPATKKVAIDNAVINANDMNAYVRQYKDGLHVYGANETVGTLDYFQGWQENTTVDMVKTGTSGQYQIWGKDNLSSVTAGDDTLINTKGIYKMKNALHYDSRAAMKGTSHDLSAFANSKYWVVVDNAPVWAGARKASSVATINGEEISAENVYELNVNENATVDVKASSNDYNVVINSVEITNDSVAVSNGATITAISAGETTYTVNATVDNINVTFTGILRVNRNIVNVDNPVKYFNYNDIFAFNFDGNIESATATFDEGDVELEFANGIILSEQPSKLVVSTNKAVYTLNNIVFDEELPLAVDSTILYNKFKLDLDYDFGEDIFTAYMNVEGQRVNIYDNGNFDIPAVPTTASSNVVEICVVSANNVYVLSNVEYWDEIITTVKDFSNTLDYTANDSAVIGWYALGNNIDFKLAASGAYTITDLEHEFDLHFGNSSFNAIYYLFDRFDSNSKSDIFVSNADNGFGGIFDGKGYTMSNFINLYAATNKYIYSDNGGFFGKLYSTETITPVVKNFALIDFVDGSASPVLADTVSPAGVQRIENIYINNKQTAYAGYTYDITTNVSTADIALGGYGVAGIVRDVGHTYMKNVVYRHKYGEAAYNYNVIHGKTSQGSLASSFNKIDPAQTPATYDATYLDNVIVISRNLLHVDNMNASTFTKRGYGGTDGFAAYGANMVAVSNNDAGYKVPQNSGVADYDDYANIVAGDASQLANGVYKFANVLHYYDDDCVATDNDLTIAALNKLVETPVWTATIGSNANKIYWAGVSGMYDNVTIGNVSVDNGTTLDVYKNDELDVAVNCLGESIQIKALSSSNTSVATVSGTMITAVGVGETTITLSYSIGTNPFYKKVVLNVATRPVDVDNTVYYYPEINKIAYDILGETLSVKYFVGEEEFDIGVGEVIPDAAFSADKVVVATTDATYYFNNLVKVVGGEQVDETVLYDADTKSFYGYEFNGELVDAYAILDGVKTATPIENGKFAINYAPETNENNMIKVVVMLNNGVYTFNNVQYWDYIIDDGEEYVNVMGYDATDSYFKKFVTLANNIDLRITEDITNNISDEANNIIMVKGSGVVKSGAYYTLNNNTKETHELSYPEWFNDGNQKGFAGVFDGRGYAISNVLLVKHAEQNGNNHNPIDIGTNGGIFGQFCVTDTMVPVVKNVAYIDVVLSTNQVFASYMYNSSATKKATFENVYVKILANCSFGASFNTDGFVAPGTINGYGSNPLFNRLDRASLTNCLIEHVNISNVANNDASGAHGSLYSKVTNANAANGGYDPIVADSCVTNVLYITKGMLHSGVTYACNRNTEVVNIIKNSGSLAYERTYEKGFFVYGVNETVGTQEHFLGFNDGAAIDTLTIDDIKWGFDDLTQVEPGVIGNGFYRLTDVYRYTNYDALAADETYAPTILATFTASCWNVDLNARTISWASIA